MDSLVPPPIVTDAQAQRLRQLLTQRGLVLRFPGDIEALYTQGYAEKYLRLNQVYTLVALATMVFLTMLDYMVTPTVAPTSIVQRLPVCLVGLAGMFLSSRQWLVLHHQSMLTILSAVVVISYLYTGWLASLAGHNHYATLCLLAIIYVSFMMRLQFKRILPICALLLLVCGIGVVSLYALSYAEVWIYCVIYLMTAPLIFTASYRADADDRRNFIQTTLLKHEQKKLEDARNELQTLSQTDMLTQSYNRRYLDSQLPLAWRACERNKQWLSLVMIDIDCFKAYNDHYGHQAGDQCLQRVAECIRDQVKRPRDFAARFGGEEFLVVLPDTDPSAAAKVAERIRKAIAELNITHEHTLLPTPVVTVSLGVSGGQPDRDSDPDALVKQADQALYAAKESGRNQISVYRSIDLSGT